MAGHTFVAAAEGCVRGRSPRTTNLPILPVRYALPIDDGYAAVRSLRQLLQVCVFDKAQTKKRPEPVGASDVRRCG